MVLKCKMCGGDLNIEEGMTVCECEYCNTKQTVPTVDDEKKIKLFERANRFRMECQFDKAASVYESIIEEFDTEAEGYWGNLLCKYGIEYVDDPATGDKVPTCHRSSFDSFMDDKDFESVMDYADSISRSVYREQAKQIEEIRKGIIEVSGREEPYDIFICYKETAEDGQRTLDSVLAQDIYEALTDKGYRVFFSRITLEDKLGTEYEPYIFAALNSAKVMLAFGTTYDYYNAVWVKNEWSRYLKLMAKDKTKHLIPCYKDIDAYDIPKEFAKLQAQDLGKVGATQDLLRGIEKIIGSKKKDVVQNGSNINVSAMIKRGNLALEDKEWSKADEFFEEALNQDPESSDAYLGKLMAELRISGIEELKNCDESFVDSLNYKKVMRFGTNDIKAILDEGISIINTRITEREHLKAEEEKRLETERIAVKEAEYQKALVCLGLVSNPEQESMELEENQRHEEVINGLKTELSEAEENAKQQEIILKNQKSKVESEYEQSLSALDKSLEDTRVRYKEILQRKEQELSSLGIFAGKRKKELSQEIVDNKSLLDKEECETKSKIELLKKEHQYQQSIISKKLTTVHDEEERIQEKINLENTFHANNSEKIVSRTRDYENGLQILEELGDYKDCIKLKNKYTLLSRSIGDIVTFGKYEWKVLNICDNKMLLIANDAVAEGLYNNVRTSVTWSSCGLRNWLNSDFINDGFNSEEQARIMITTISPGKNPEYSTNAGNSTDDKVFLLSIDEVNQYFRTDSFRKCKYKGDACWWWLRSPGDNQNKAAIVSYNGSVNCKGRIVNRDGSQDSIRFGSDLGLYAVRPAMWINLES